MKVYGSRVSYYTGKLEAYLRYKGIAYQPLPMPYDQAKMLREKVGAVQMPIVECDDGRWMSDTTPILLHLEQERPDCPIVPAAPAVGFVARLIEDYGDEWLWRPAMHYRWSYRHDRLLISNILVDEIGNFSTAPRWLKRRLIARRQFTSFVRKDGVDESTRAHVEATYAAALDAMERMLENRQFLLGDAPTLADFGMMGPMFRHFGQDPTPAEIMRNRAPGVFAWVARMWNARGNPAPCFVTTIPDDASVLLREICATHLVQLAANAEAFARGAAHFAMDVQGCRYTRLPTSRYRVWCLEVLRSAFAELDDAAQAEVRRRLPFAEAECLWASDMAFRSNYNSKGLLPFGQAINVYGDGTPP